MQQILTQILQAYKFDAKAANRLEKSVSWTDVLLVASVLVIALNWLVILLDQTMVLAEKLLSMAVILVMIPIGWFITYGLYHLFMLMLGVPSKFTSTLSLGLLIGLPVVIITTLLQLLLVLMNQFVGFSNNWIELLWTIPVILVVMGISFWSLAAVIYAYSKIYHASIARVFIAIFVIPMAIALFIALIIMVFIFVLLGGAAW